MSKTKDTNFFKLVTILYGRAQIMLILDFQLQNYFLILPLPPIPASRYNFDIIKTEPPYTPALINKISEFANFSYIFL